MDEERERRAGEVGQWQRMRPDQENIKWACIPSVDLAEAEDELSFRMARFKCSRRHDRDLGNCCVPGQCYM